MSIANIARMLCTSFHRTRTLLIEDQVPILSTHTGRVEMTESLVFQIIQDGVATSAMRLGVDYATLRFHLEKWVAQRSLAQIQNEELRRVLRGVVKE